MSEYTVGFDFGTHQTKVCIENAANPRQKLYEFLEFFDGNKKTPLFPSLVQINLDDTISYGFVDDNNCKIKDLPPRPVLTLLEQNNVILPPKPKMIAYPKQPITDLSNMTWKEKLLFLTSNGKEKQNEVLSAWENECKKIDAKNRALVAQHKAICDKLLQEADVTEENNRRRKQYAGELAKWKESNSGENRLRFRYFKLASLYGGEWPHKELSSDMVSVWYIAYVLQLIDNHIGKDYVIQIGTPTGGDANSASVRNHAYALMIAAIKLKNSYSSLREYLKANYHELSARTQVPKRVTDDDLNTYCLDSIPEAYAGLRALTRQRRIERGKMQLLVDIGGGTTDIAFFTVSEKRMPDIHSILSFPKGLNYVFEETRKKTGKELYELQTDYMKPTSNFLFKDAVDAYKSLLRSNGSNMLNRVVAEFNSQYYRHQLSETKLRECMQGNPVVYCGGGSIKPSIRTAVSCFSDIIPVDKSMLDIPSVVNKGIEDKLYPILATSYGLSIPIDEELKMTPLANLFANLDQSERGNTHVKGSARHLNHHEPTSSRDSFDYGLDYDALK